MIIYNITTLVSWEVHDDWKEWMMNEHIPRLMATGLFTRHQLVKLLEVNEDDGLTYALQLYVNSAEDFRLYREKHLRRFQENEIKTWGDDATSFASLMEVVN